MASGSGADDLTYFSSNAKHTFSRAFQIKGESENPPSPHMHPVLPHKHTRSLRGVEGDVAAMKEMPLDAP